MNIRTIRTKIYIVCILSILLLLGILYLMLTGKIDDIKKAYGNNKENVVEVSEEPCSIESDCGPVEVKEKDKEEATEETTQETKETTEENKEETTKEENKEDKTSETNEETNKEVDKEENKEQEETKEETEDNKETGNKEEDKDKKTVDVTTDSSINRIVNPTMKVNAEYEPNDLVSPNVQQYGNQLLRQEASTSLEEMFANARNDGINLFLISGYRSYQEQDDLYHYYINQGYQNMEMSDSVPGGTEHQLGLSVDLGSIDHVCELNTCFNETAAYEWLKEHSYQYGYIERHPVGKEEYTHIASNPWSFRYIGKEEAKKVYDSGKALEEYYLSEEN